MELKIEVELDRLMARAKEMHAEIEDESYRLGKVLEIGSRSEVTMRADSLMKHSMRLLYIAGKIDALREVEYLSGK